jgi:hypothetical protein
MLDQIVQIFLIPIIAILFSLGNVLFWWCLIQNRGCENVIRVIAKAARRRVLGRSLLLTAFCLLITAAILGICPSPPNNNEANNVQKNNEIDNTSPSNNNEANNAQKNNETYNVKSLASLISNNFLHAQLNNWFIIQKMRDILSKHKISHWGLALLFANVLLFLSMLLLCSVGTLAKIRNHINGKNISATFKNILEYCEKLSTEDTNSYTLRVMARELFGQSFLLLFFEFIILLVSIILLTISLYYFVDDTGFANHLLLQIPTPSINEIKKLLMP